MKRLLLIILSLSFFSGRTQQVSPLQTSDSIQQMEWVNQLMDSMTVEEKIGQLFMVAAYSNKDEKHEKFIADLIETIPYRSPDIFSGSTGKAGLTYQQIPENFEIPAPNWD